MADINKILNKFTEQSIDTPQELDKLIKLRYDMPEDPAGFYRFIRSAGTTSRHARKVFLAN